MKFSKLEKAVAGEIAMKFIDYYYSYLTATRITIHYLGSK